MLKFAKVSLGTNMGSMAFYRLIGLPEGESCILAPEDDTKPRGEWYVAVKRAGKNRTIRCESLADAKEAAMKWGSRKKGAKS